MPRRLGKVKSFNEDKGFGFITLDDGIMDVYVHSSEVINDGFQILEEGMSVEFEVAQGPKGPVAVKVVIMS